MSLQDERGEVGEACRLHLRHERRHVDAAVLGSVGSQTPRGLLELAPAADPPPSAGLVPGDRDVDEPLEEVALRRLGRAPCFLERLVRREVLAATQQLDPLCECRVHRYLSSMPTILLAGV